MNEPESIHSRFQDDRLADFADRALAGEAKQIDPNIDDQLRGLEQTVLRLQQAFPKQTLDPAWVRQMQVRLNNRLNKQPAAHKQAARHIWPAQNWQSQRSRQRVALLLVGVAILASIIIIPALQALNPPVTGTAGLNSPVLIAALMLLGALALGLWLSRRK